MSWLARVFGLEEVEREDAIPLEGTRMSLWNSAIPDWWSTNVTGTLLGTPQLAERVWVANRCQQMNAQQIASMPLEWHGPPTVQEPAWVNSPDPNWFPNGIGDAVHAIVDQMYRWGFALLYITDFYATGFPRTWTVLDSSICSVRLENGARAYKFGDSPLPAGRIVQIDRNPGKGLTGTSALSAYAQLSYGLLAAGNQSLVTSQGGIPKFYLKSERKLTSDQADSLRDEWMEKTSLRNGAPPIVPPDITPTEMSFDPSDLALLDTQEFNAKAIATAYGVPSVLLNMALQGGLTYQNPGALGEMWWRFELRPTSTRVANALSAQMLPAGQWVSFRAEDTFAPLTAQSPEDDEQSAIVQPPSAAGASPAQQPGRLTAIGGGG